MIRKVMEDTDFTTADGDSYLIRKGDRVAMYPPAIHYDEEIFPEPEVRIKIFSAQKYDKYLLVKKAAREIRRVLTL